VILDAVRSKIVRVGHGSASPGLHEGADSSTRTPEIPLVSGCSLTGVEGHHRSEDNSAWVAVQLNATRSRPIRRFALEA